MSERRRARKIPQPSYPPGPINAVLRGSGAIAQALQKAIALGTRSIYLDGDNAGVVNTGFNVAVNLYRNTSKSGLGKQEMAKALQAYLNKIEEITNNLLILPVKANPDKKTAELKNLFVALDVTKTSKDKTETSPCGHILNLCPDKHVVILAKEGQGKTVILLNLANALSQALRTKRGHEQYSALRKNLGESSYKDLPIPVYLPLNTYADAVSQQTIWGANLKTFLDHHLAQLSLTLLPNFFSVLLESGQPVALLLDGMDEIIDSALRGRIAEQIKNLSFGEHNVQFIVSSRESAYTGHSVLGNSFDIVRIDPFDEDKRERQIRKIYRSIKKDDKTAEYAVNQTLFEIVQLEQRHAKESRRLIDSPLMTTLAVGVREYKHGALPDHRITFLLDAIEALLNGDYVAEAAERASLQNAVGGWEKHLHMLSVVARAIFDTNDFSLNKDRLTKILTNEKIEPNAIGALINYAETRGSPLRKQSDGLYWFMHGALRDALAAQHIAQNSKSAREMALAVAGMDAIANEHGQNVAYLLAGYLHENHLHLSLGSTIFADFIKELLIRADDIALPPATRLGCIQVALDAMRDHASQNSVLYARLVKTAALIYDDMPMMDMAPLDTRLTLGKILTTYGDPRKHVMTSDAMRFCLVPPGPFLMGSEPADSGAYDDEKCGEQEWLEQGFDIPYAYWIGQHPVTNAQFGEFINDNGYTNPKWWGQAIHAGVWKNGLLVKRYIGVSTKAHTPEEKEAEYKAGHGREVEISEAAASEIIAELSKAPNHPVAFITWYEAMAYCEWLTARWRARGWLDNHHNIRLPNEPEWEKAARGGIMLPEQPCLLEIQHLGAESKLTVSPPLTQTNEYPRRAYPWGNEISLSRMNILASGPRGITPAGCFTNGRSPYGCLDMAGNVFEWTRSLWGPVWLSDDDHVYHSQLDFRYPYRLEDGRETTSADKDTGRILRGGAWNHDHFFARCAVRSWVRPDAHFNYAGFRILVAPV